MGGWLKGGHHATFDVCVIVGGKGADPCGQRMKSLRQGAFEVMSTGYLTINPWALGAKDAGREREEAVAEDLQCFCTWHSQPYSCIMSITLLATAQAGTCFRMSQRSREASIYCR